MRDPWIPLLVVLVVLLAVWLGVLGPLPEGVPAWLERWQTLLGASIAVLAAAVAFRGTTRSLRAAQTAETYRRNRKQASLRAVLPLALARVIAYTEQSARELNALTLCCLGNHLPKGIASDSVVVALPSETLRTLAEFIEYSDAADVTVLEAVIALIQIHDSRVRELLLRNARSSLARGEIDARIIDAASIYAGATAVFEYARGLQAQLPRTVSWADVRSALWMMDFGDDHPTLHELVTIHETLSTGPFQTLQR